VNGPPADVQLIGMRATISLLVLGAAALAAPQGWRKTLDGGVAAARKCGKPVLVVTLWRTGL